MLGNCMTTKRHWGVNATPVFLTSRCSSGSSCYHLVASV